MPAPETVHVDVVITQNPIPAGGGFQLRSRIFADGMLNFRNQGNPGFIVIFNIVDETPAPVFRFAADLDQALWVRPFIGAGEDCPAAQCQWGQFDAQTVTGNGQTLIVRNRNEFTQKFGFVLQVTKDPAGLANLQQIDPIGNNQNGPQ